MRPTGEIARLLETLQKLLKQKGYKYKELADYLEVSLPTVKRIFSKAEVSLQRLSSICDFLDISLVELMDLSKSSTGDEFYFTKSQEEFFARNPSYLAYLFALKDSKSPEEIEHQYRLDKGSTKKYLAQLQKMRLIQISSKGRLIVKIKGTVIWDDHGVLGNTFSRNMIAAFSNWALDHLADPKSLSVKLRGWELTKAQFEAFNKDCEAVFSKYRQLSNYNKKVLQTTDTEYVSAMMIADFWDDQFFSRITNV